MPESRVRALLFVAPVLALAGVVIVLSLSRRDPKPPARAPEEAQANAEPATAAAAPTPEADAPALRAAPAPALSVASPTEDSLAAQMHALEETSPERALDLAQQGQARWPAGPRAPEFAATEVKCLYRLGKPSEGRGAAEAMVNKYPSSPWALEVEKQTGAHPYVRH